ncbi:Hypothetical predicted protein [Pelobates cultripes]|uniref:Uncharacterized protein n=1 Tax=Pelobates cultripes TaxID=61616 RepID=A0AAD1WTM7_PELCU|nr:Hypothetical predicted protein [Pelobates cultripes]
MADNPRPHAQHYVETKQCTGALAFQHAGETNINVWDKLPDYPKKPETPGATYKQRDEGRKRSGSPLGTPSKALLRPYTTCLPGLKTTRHEFPELRPLTQRIRHPRQRILTWIQRCPIHGKNPASHRSNLNHGPEMQAFSDGLGLWGGLARTLPLALMPPLKPDTKPGHRLI